MIYVYSNNFYGYKRNNPSQPIIKKRHMCIIDDADLYEAGLHTNHKCIFASDLIEYNNLKYPIFGYFIKEIRFFDKRDFESQLKEICKTYPNYIIAINDVENFELLNKKPTNIRAGNEPKYNYTWGHVKTVETDIYTSTAEIRCHIFDDNEEFVKNYKTSFFHFWKQYSLHYQKTHPTSIIMRIWNWIRKII